MITPEGAKQSGLARRTKETTTLLSILGEGGWAYAQKLPMFKTLAPGKKGPARHYKAYIKSMIEEKD